MSFKNTDQRKIILSGLLIIFLGTISQVRGQSESWPMFMHDAKHTSRTSLSAVQTPILKWSLPLDLSITAAPVAAPDGTIYIGSEDKKLYAVNRLGTILWNFPAGGAITASPAIDPNGKIYFGSQDHFFYALNQNGTLAWKYETGGVINSSPTVISGKDSKTSAILIASGDKKLYAFSSSGSLLWSTSPLQYGIDFSSPAVTSEKLIALGTLGNSVAWSSGKVYLQSPNGSEHCGFDLGFYKGNGIRSSVSVTETNNILFGTKDDLAWGPGVFSIINDDCQLICQTSDLNHLQSSPAIGASGTFYLGTTQGLKAIRESCSVAWTAPVGNISFSTAAIDRNEIIYIGSNNGYLFAVNPNGTIKWQFKIGEPLGSPVIGPGGEIYIASETKLFAFYQNRLGYPPSPW